MARVLSQIPRLLATSGVLWGMWGNFGGSWFKCVLQDLGCFPSYESGTLAIHRDSECSVMSKATASASKGIEIWPQRERLVSIAV